MSRLIVKNLPAYLSDVRLREHFSQRGVVTDVKLMTRPDGTSRRFGFVGYRSDEEAKDALEYFNRTFIDTSRIQVDLAKKIGDEGLADEAKRRRDKRDGVAAVEAAPAQSSNDKKVAKSSKASKASNAASSSKGVSFEEFMAVMAPKKKRKTWQNEEDDPEQQLKATQGDQDAADEKKDRKRAKKEAAKSTESKMAAVEAVGEEADQSASAHAEDDDEHMPEDEALNDEGLTDLDYMAKRMRRNVGVEPPSKPAAVTKDFEQSDSEADNDDDDGDANSSSSSDGESSEDEESKAQAKAREEKQRLALEKKARKDQEAVDTIMGSGRLFVRNLPFAATEEDLERHFAVFGSVKQVHITLDKTTKTSKGMAYVHYHDPAHALSAYRGADGTTFQGRLLHLLPAVDLRPKPEQGPTLKQSRAADLKANADKDFNWSSLYMSADAVASSVAERLGISKADILNPSDEAGGGGDSAAVRLALAETKVIRETKDFLEREGIDVTSLEGRGGKVRRSDTTILVKNIPFGTTSEAIRELFEKHGDVDRVLIPPAGTIALVEMVVPGEARVAFRALAYKRIGNSVIYLEKAPEGMVQKSTTTEEVAASGPTQRQDVSATKPISIAGAPAAAAAAQGEADDSSSSSPAGATLFIKNLNFATTDAALSHLFSTLPDFAFARVQTRLDSRDPTKRLSMGYGFVGYRTVPAAQTALSTLQGKELDGHSLVLSFAKRGQDEDDNAGRGGAGKEEATTKLIVKNLPFEATRKDVRALFAAHGQVKSVRVPRKAAALSGPSQAGARGFAFIEFTSKREAQGAFEALRHAHYLGRHLILQWDREDERGVEGMREKVRESFEGAKAAQVGARGRNKVKLKLGQEDIAEAAGRERERREDVDDE